MPQKTGAKRIPDEKILGRIKTFFYTEGRVPKSNEFGNAFCVLVKSRFGSWENAVKLATGEKSMRHFWTDDELLSMLRELRKNNGRFPTPSDLATVKPSMKETLRLRFGDVQSAFERAYGDSPRLILLRAVKVLTPPNCDSCSTQEVGTEVRKSGLPFTNKQVSVALVDCRDDGYLAGGRVSHTVLWKLTGKGRELLKQYLEVSSQKSVG